MYLSLEDIKGKLNKINTSSVLDDERRWELRCGLWSDVARQKEDCETFLQTLVDNQLWHECDLYRIYAHDLEEGLKLF
jgi:hypothetical protein